MRNTMQNNTWRVDLVQRPGRNLVAVVCVTRSLDTVLSPFSGSSLFSGLAPLTGIYEELRGRFIARDGRLRPVAHLVRVMRPLRHLMAHTLTSWAQKRKTPLACPSFAVKRS